MSGAFEFERGLLTEHVVHDADTLLGVDGQDVWLRSPSEGSMSICWKIFLTLVKVIFR